MFPIHRRAALAGLAAAVAGWSRNSAAQAQLPRIEMRPDLGRHFLEAGTTGTIAIADLKGSRLVVTDRERAERPFLPASTFKIPNSLIALETGVAQDADHPVFPWDGTSHPIEAWNKEHTLRSGIKVSSVPTYQQIARQIGPETMQKYVDAFDYGNRDIGGGIDTFWLTGEMRITAMQQLAFLEKLYRGTLPVEKRNQDIVKDIMLLEQNEFGVMRGKTGAARGAGVDGRNTLGWLVGWLERSSDAYLFAMNMDVQGDAHMAQRLPLTKALLQEAIPL